MFDGGIVPFLSLFTLLAVAVLALISKERTKDRMRDPNAPVSSLATDGKYGGVAFLRPLSERVRDGGGALVQPGQIRPGDGRAAEVGVSALPRRDEPRTVIRDGGLILEEGAR